MAVAPFGRFASEALGLLPGRPEHRLLTSASRLSLGASTRMPRP